MADRRSFLGAVSGAAATLVLAARADAQQTPPAAAPSPAPSASASPKPPSAGARAQAEAMRRFDPQLTDAQVETIARGIDGIAGEGDQLNPHGTLLHNGDEPLTRFAAEAAR